MVRKDLPDRPPAGKIGGSTHNVDDHGLFFLFNPNPEIPARFRLDKESIELTHGGRFEVSQSYRTSTEKRTGSIGFVGIPDSTALVLTISSVKN